MTWNIPDVIIGSLLALSILIGIIRGFTKEFISLITWIVAIGMTALFTERLAEHFTFTDIPLLRMACAFLVLFVGVIFIGAVINYVVGSLVKKTPFQLTDKIIGSLLGLVRGVVLMTIAVLIGALTPLPSKAWWHESYMLVHFSSFADWLKEQLPEEHAKAFQRFASTETTLSQSE